MVLVLASAADAGCETVLWALVSPLMIKLGGQRRRELGGMPCKISKSDCKAR